MPDSISYKTMKKLFGNYQMFEMIHFLEIRANISSFFCDIPSSQLVLPCMQQQIHLRLYLSLKNVE